MQKNQGQVSSGARQGCQPEVNLGVSLKTRHNLANLQVSEISEEMSKFLENDGNYASVNETITISRQQPKSSDFRANVWQRLSIGLNRKPSISRKSGEVWEVSDVVLGMWELKHKSIFDKFFRMQWKGPWSDPLAYKRMYNVSPLTFVAGQS